MSLDFDFSSLMIGILFGIVGWSAWRYGKNTSSLRHMLLGGALMVYPYFIPQVWASLTVGLILSVFLFWP